ncbi:uncharacterized protein LOC100377330 [Saccoglossus kowalevskii]
MPYEDPPQDSLALCGTCWMFTGVFVLVLGLVLTALGYVENYVIAFRIAGPCFIGGSCLMLTAATACCVSAHIKDKSRLRRNARPSRPIRQHATNSRHRSRNHSRSRPSSHSRTTSFQNRQVRINSIPQVEVVPPTPQLHPNLNALVGLTFLPPMQSGRLGTPISDEEMLSDYDNVPKKRRGYVGVIGSIFTHCLHVKIPHQWLTLS